MKAYSLSALKWVFIALLFCYLQVQLFKYTFDIKIHYKFTFNILLFDKDNVGSVGMIRLLKGVFFFFFFSFNLKMLTAKHLMHFHVKKWIGFQLVHTYLCGHSYSF